MTQYIRRKLKRTSQIQQILHLRSVNLTNQPGTTIVENIICNQSVNKSIYGGKGMFKGEL